MERRSGRLVECRLVYWSSGRQIERPSGRGQKSVQAREPQLRSPAPKLRLMDLGPQSEMWEDRRGETEDCIEINVQSVRLDAAGWR